jgi:hypothetical protein
MVVETRELKAAANFNFWDTENYSFHTLVFHRSSKSCIDSNDFSVICECVLAVAQ